MLPPDDTRLNAGLSQIPEFLTDRPRGETESLSCVEDPSPGRSSILANASREEKRGGGLASDWV